MNTYRENVRYISIGIPKNKVKKAVESILSISATTLIIGGIFLIYGTAGASDLGDVTIVEIIKNVVIGFAMLGGAWILNKLKMYCK